MILCGVKKDTSIRVQNKQLIKEARRFIQISG